MTTGEKLALLRKEKNITQEELADVLGVSRQSISKWEQDRAFPETEKLIKLSEIYNCSIDYLLKDEDKVIGQEKSEIIINKKRVWPTFIWSVVNFIIIPLLFLLPIENKIIVDIVTLGKNEYATDSSIQLVNFYNLFKDDNMMFFLFGLPLLLEFITIVMSIMLVIFKRKGWYVARFLTACEALVLFLIACLVPFRIIDNLHIGLFVLLGVKLFNIVGLAVFKFNRYSYIQQEL